MSSQPSSVAPSVPQDSTDHVYTIIVRGESFQLCHSQIHFDAPNFFTNCFSSGFAEATTRVLRLHRNPTTFAIIVDYLSGYPILPLAAQAHALPCYIDVVVLQRYLLEDARFYNLQGLCDLLITPKPATDLSWTGYANEMVSLWDVARGELPEGVVRQADGSVVSEESGLPVLAYAQNVVVQVTLIDLATLGLDWERPKRVLLTFVAPNDASLSPSQQDIQMSLDESFGHSITDPSPPFIGTAERKEYWCRQDGTPVRECGQLVVDGHQLTAANFEMGWCVLRNLCRADIGARVSDSENWIPCYHYLPDSQSRWEQRRIVYMTYTLLANSFICRIRPWRGIGPHSPLVEPIPVDLVRASLRTRSSILGELGAQMDRN